MLKKIILGIILIFPLSLHAGQPKASVSAGLASTTPEVIIELNKSFLLEVNQKALLKEEGLNIFAVEVFDDLCKDGMDCSEGSMSIRLQVSKGGEKKDLLLTSKDGRKPVKPVVMEAFGYKIQLLEMGESAAMLIIKK